MSLFLIADIRYLFEPVNSNCKVNRLVEISFPDVELSDHRGDPDIKGNTLLDSSKNDLPAWTAQSVPASSLHISDTAGRGRGSPPTPGPGELQ